MTVAWRRSVGVDEFVQAEQYLTKIDQRLPWLTGRSVGRPTLQERRADLEFFDGRGSSHREDVTPLHRFAERLIRDWL